MLWNAKAKYFFTKCFIKRIIYYYHKVIIITITIIKKLILGMK